MKIFNTFMTATALATILMAFAPKAHAGTVDATQNNPMPIKSQCTPICTTPAVVSTLYICKPITGWYFPEIEREKQRKIEEQREKQLQKERKHNLRFYGYAEPDEGIALRAYLYPELIIKAAKNYVFYGDDDLLLRLRSKAHHFPYRSSTSESLLDERLNAAIGKYQAAQKKKGSRLKLCLRFTAGAPELDEEKCMK